MVNYTNAATIINKAFKDAEELDGVFSGLKAYTGDPLNGFLAQYDNDSWQYARRSVGELQESAPLRDETLQDPRCVLQILKHHYSRYTPEMVERVTGCPQELFLRVAETILANSGRDRTTGFCYAVGWTQHTYGPQMIGCCALLQLLLGNIGRPGGGVVALRGHATIQGSTDIPTLYHSIHGYMSAPSALKKHNTLTDYLASQTPPTGLWANIPKFMISYLKSMYGDAATQENNFGYDWHPKITGDHSHLPMMIAMFGGLTGFFLAGYTGVLLSVTNRPIWADTNLVGLLFLLSGASTAAATLVLVSLWRGNESKEAVHWLSRFDSMVLAFELLALLALVVSLGSVARLWLTTWGGLLLVGVVLAGILLPLVLHWRPRLLGHLNVPMAAALVLVGGFLLRVVVVLSSEGV